MGASPLTEGHSSGLEVRYQATLSGDGTATPVLTRVQVTFSGDSPTTEWDYSYDSAGNLTEVDTITAAGTATEVRDNPSWPAGDQINDLNQILRNDVTPAGGSTTTYRYTYNADGTMDTKTDGTTTWTYNWDPVGTQRLLSVDVGGGTQVAYTYDSLGRMLTRTPYSGGVAGTPTSFEWDGMTVVRETTPNGVYRYYAPQGELITFDYTPNGGSTASYSAHADAIGSIRAITDASGAPVARFEYDAWGNLLPTSDFGPLSDWSYLFVGSLGVRWDGTTGLYYMRQRWYDPGLQRFVSRDPLGIDGGFDPYAYTGGNPVLSTDTTGLNPVMDAIHWWIWQSNLPGPYGNPNPSQWGKWNDLVAQVCQQGTKAERIIFMTSLVTGTAAAATALGTGIYEFATDSRVLVEGRRGGRLFQIRSAGREGVFRLDYHVLGRHAPGELRDIRFLHYHRFPDMALHRPFQGSLVPEAIGLGTGVATIVAAVITCKPEKQNQCQGR